MDTPNNEKDSVVEKDDNKSDTLPQSEQTDKKTSPSADASGNKGLEDELANTKKAYSESSKEAKRLVAENKEMTAAYSDTKKQIDELNEYIDILESKKESIEEEKKDEEPKEEKKEERENVEKKAEKPARPSTDLTSAMKEVEYDKKWKENYEKEKSIEKDAQKKLAEAKEKYPGMAKKSYRRRVQDKMSADGNLNILGACEKVEKDIELERAEIEGDEPFVESGSGVKGSQPPTKGDEIIDHLMGGDTHAGGLEGL